MRVLLTRWTAPRAIVHTLITKWLFFCLAVQLVFRFPLFKADTMLAENQKVRRVVMAQHLRARFGLIAQFEGLGLIVEFEYIGVVLHEVNRPQLDGVALKLDRDAYFARWVGSTLIVGTRGVEGW